METRLCSLFKTANAMTLTKSILENLQSSAKFMKKNDLKTARTISKGRSVLGYFQRLNCYNFPLIFYKVFQNMTAL